ncbi:hypothetical protein NKH63_26435 [Mesorhizobium sp. M0960]|uniref:hypothetical protein n=1 Tax=Mesorhizobium sp. M0960 TaxID=2957035 RepID=UPI00333965BE
MPLLEAKGPSYIYDEESAIYSSLIAVAEELGIVVKSEQSESDEIDKTTADTENIAAQ